MRDALSIFDQLMSYGGGTITLQQIQGLLGVTAAQEITALSEAFLRADVGAALAVVARVAAQGADIRQFSRDIVNHLRLVMLVKADPQGTELDVAESEAESIRSQAQRAQMSALVAWLRRLSELDFELRTSPYGQLPLELAVVEAIAAPQPAATAPAPAPARMPSPVAPAPRVEQPRTENTRPNEQPRPAEHTRPSEPPRAAEQPVPQPVRPDAVPSAQPQPVPVAPRAAEERNDAATPLMGERIPFVDVTDLSERWPAIVRDIRAKNRNLEALIKSGIHPFDVTEDTVTLKTDTDWLLAKVQERPNLLLIEQILERHTGKVYRIRSVAATQKREASNAKREILRDTSNIPIVKAAMNVFDADVVGIETPQKDD
jgi:DNA polymerase-3 subunit gamma/tau